MKKTLGKQVFIELYGCNARHLDNIAFVEVALVKAAKLAKATIVKTHFHQYAPHGISGTVIIMESHINIHTWPEHDYAAVDIFTCGENMELERAIRHLAEVFESQKHEYQVVNRGDIQTIRSLHVSQTQHHHQ